MSYDVSIQFYDTSVRKIVPSHIKKKLHLGLLILHLILFQSKLQLCVSYQKFIFHFSIPFPKLGTTPNKSASFKHGCCQYRLTPLNFACDGSTRLIKQVHTCSSASLKLALVDTYGINIIVASGARVLR